MTHSHSSARVAERPPAPRKSPQAFRTISEVSADLDVPPHVLRFWESRFDKVRPLKRGGGRRYYRPEDVALLKGIRRLLYEEGMTIKGAKKVMRERGVRFVTGLGNGEERQGPPLSTGASDGSHSGNAHTEQRNGNGAAGPKPLLTPEKRANLEAALAVLNDLRSELSDFAGGAH